MAAWRPEVVEGGLADRPAACPRCGRAWRRRRPWKEAVLDLVEDAAVLVCLLWLGGIAGAGAVTLGGPRLPPGLLLLDVAAVTLAGIGLLGLTVRVRRMVMARAACRKEEA